MARPSTLAPEAAERPGADPKGCGLVLDPGWIEAGLRKRQAQFSTVVCCQTRDQTRVWQLLDFLAQRPDLRAAAAYRFTPWRGLRCRDQETGAWRGVARQAAAGDPIGAARPVASLDDALRLMDEALRRELTVFVLYDLEPMERDGSLSRLAHALRAWALDPDILLAGSLVVLVTGEPELVLDHLTQERVALATPPLATADERRSVIEDVARRLGLETARQAGREARLVGAGDRTGSTLSEVVHATSGLDLHQLRSVLHETYLESGEFSVAGLARRKAEWVRRSQVVEVEDPLPHGFAAVGGYVPVKEFVWRSMVALLRQPDRAARLALELPRGLLLFGPPGVGKTLFARALAGEVGLPFINLRTENLFSKFLGESGQRMRDAIRLIEQMSPAIVFIDEVDRLGMRRGATSDGASEETRRVLNQFLEWLGDTRRQSIILATTNRPDDLDDALLRPGRLDYKIPFLYPDREARREVLRIHLGLTAARPRPALALEGPALDALLNELAERTDGFTGAELEELVNRAKRLAFADGADALDEAVFRHVLATFHVDRPARARQQVAYLEIARRLTDEAAFLVQGP